MAMTYLTHPERVYRRPWWRRIRPVGEPVVPLTEQYTQSVVFIVCDDGKGTTDSRRPCGTGFIVAVPLADESSYSLYVVTAAHVVSGSQPLFVRVNKRDGTVDDLPVREWVTHPTEDVAVTPFVADHSIAYHSVKLKDFFDASRQYIVLGEPVYFVGLLGQVEAMGRTNTPMVRSGTVGALGQENVPIRGPGNTLNRVTGHLIDCRSFGGFSGSPCFVQFVRLGKPTARMGLSVPEEHTLLLGLIIGHFDLKQSITIAEPGSDLSVPVAAGIAVVCPVEAIRETLDLEELVALRDEDNQELLEARAQREYENAATPDSAESGALHHNRPPGPDLGTDADPAPRSG